MTLTITPNTEALLLAKAERDGEDVNAVADALLANLLARDQAKEIAVIRVGLQASDAGRVRPLAEVAAEKRTKYRLPTHLSDEEIFSGEEGIAHK